MTSSSQRTFTDLDGRTVPGAPVAEACPFCGAEPARIHLSPSIALFDPTAVESDDAETFAAECNECGARGVPAMTPLDAALYWNRRGDGGLRS